MEEQMIECNNVKKQLQEQHQQQQQEPNNNSTSSSDNSQLHELELKLQQATEQINAQQDQIVELQQLLDTTSTSLNNTQSQLQQSQAECRRLSATPQALITNDDDTSSQQQQQQQPQPQPQQQQQQQQVPPVLPTPKTSTIHRLEDELAAEHKLLEMEMEEHKREAHELHALIAENSSLRTQTSELENMLHAAEQKLMEFSERVDDDGVEDLLDDIHDCQHSLRERRLHKASAVLRDGMKRMSTVMATASGGDADVFMKHILEAFHTDDDKHTNNNNHEHVTTDTLANNQNRDSTPSPSNECVQLSSINEDDVITECNKSDEPEDDIVYTEKRDVIDINNNENVEITAVNKTSTVPSTGSQQPTDRIVDQRYNYDDNTPTNTISSTEQLQQQAYAPQDATAYNDSEQQQQQQQRQQQTRI